jgi:hypothetical protein
MNARIADNPGFSRINPFGTHFFDLRLGTALFALALFLALFTVCTTALLLRTTAR